MKEQFSILIQGPLNEISLQNIPNYLNFGKEVIVSHWSSDDLSLIQKYSQDNVYFINQKFPGKNIPSGCDPDSTFYWAVKSTGLGVSICQTEYLIKTRSDEYFTDLSLMIKKILENSEKLICGNIFFRKYKEIPGHIGDHIFGSKTAFLQSTYKHLLEAYRSGNVPLEYIQQRGWSAEQIVTAAFLKQKAIHFSSNTKLEKEKIEENFDVLDVNLLGTYQVCWGHMNKKWENNFKWHVNTLGDVF